MELIIKGLQLILNWLDKENQAGERRISQDREALDAISQAATKTKMYLSSVGEGEAIAENLRYELVELWRRASVRLSYENKELAQRCFDKSNFWANPSEWTEEELQSANIKLDRMIADTKALLDK